MDDNIFPRATIAACLIASVAIVAFQIGVDAWGIAAVIVTGIGVMIIMVASRDTTPLQITSPAAHPEMIESAVISAISEPVLLVIDNRVRATNKAALAMLGGHIVGEDIRLAIRHPSAAARLAADAEDGSVELTDVGSSDSRIELTVATIAPGKRIVHLIDRAARHAVEQARTDFVANASHELRTPLTAILGFVETLADDNAGGDPAIRSRFLAVMDKEAKRMQRLVDDLISLSRIEADKYMPPDDRVSMAQLLRETARELQDQQGDTPTALILNIDSFEGDVTGDRAQLSQLVHNLIGNAIKYGRPGAPVKIGLRRDAGGVRFSVTDQGEGIAPEHIPRLTERFYRVDAGRSRTMGGTGLGLAIVKHIVERHRARLDINSVLGRGTVVSVTFPKTSKSAVTETSSN